MFGFLFARDWCGSVERPSMFQLLERIVTVVVVSVFVYVFRVYRCGRVTVEWSFILLYIFISGACCECCLCWCVLVCFGSRRGGGMVRVKVEGLLM